MGSKVYLGIDPGANGGIAVISPGGAVSCIKLPDTDKAVWETLCQLVDWCNGNWEATGERLELYAAIEQQTARPTYIPSQGRSTVLASTCELMGNYRMLRAMLVAADVKYEDVPPKSWQSWLNVKKKCGEGTAMWKNRLKALAQQIFKDVKVTLATADALLLAWYIKGIDGACASKTRSPG